MNLLAQAKLERDRLNKVIALLEGTTPTQTTASSKKPKPHGKVWTDAERRKMSIKMKAVRAAALKKK